MKFNLTANEKMHEGFKLSFDASSPEEVKICQELTKLLIEKITKIEIEIKSDNY